MRDPRLQVILSLACSPFTGLFLLGLGLRIDRDSSQMTIELANRVEQRHSCRGLSLECRPLVWLPEGSRPQPWTGTVCQARGMQTGGLHCCENSPESGDRANARFHSWVVSGKGRGVGARRQVGGLHPHFS